LINAEGGGRGEGDIPEMDPFYAGTSFQFFAGWGRILTDFLGEGGQNI